MLRAPATRGALPCRQRPAMLLICLALDGVAGLDGHRAKRRARRIDDVEAPQSLDPAGFRGARDGQAKRQAGSARSNDVSSSVPSKWRRHETGRPNREKANFVKRREAFANPRRMQFTDSRNDGRLEAPRAGGGRARPVPDLHRPVPIPGSDDDRPAHALLGRTGDDRLSAGLAASRLIGGRPRHPIARATAVALLSTLPQIFIVSWALVQIRPGRMIALANLPMLFLSVLAIQAIIVGIQAWLSAHPGSVGADGSAGEEPGPLAQGRLARSLRGDLVALEAEDHYVRLHHPAGSTLILHRFSDALAEIDPRAGLHRRGRLCSSVRIGCGRCGSRTSRRPRRVAQRDRTGEWSRCVTPSASSLRHIASLSSKIESRTSLSPAAAMSMLTAM